MSKLNIDSGIALTHSQIATSFNHGRLQRACCQFYCETLEEITGTDIHTHTHKGIDSGVLVTEKNINLVNNTVLML